jgi:hypothetical protein
LRIPGQEPAVASFAVGVWVVSVVVVVAAADGGVAVTVSALELKRQEPAVTEAVVTFALSYPFGG